MANSDSPAPFGIPHQRLKQVKASNAAKNATQGLRGPPASAMAARNGARMATMRPA